MMESEKLFLFCLLLAICVLSAPVNDDEDDVILNDEQLRMLTDKSRKLPEEPMKEKYKWPMTNQKPYRVIVPVVIREKDFTKEALNTFLLGLRDIERETCVRFVDRKPYHKDFIFVYDSGIGKCDSKLGKVGGQQALRLTNACMVIRKKCVHEVMHALGFNHMHQRYDRNNSVIIKYENIAEKNHKWFDIYDNEWEAYNTPYDVWSCMHYAKDGFTENGKITIQTKNPKFQDEIGTQFTLNKGDAQRIVRMYRCPGQYWTKLSQ